MYPEKIIIQIEFEIKQLDKLLQAYGDLLDECKRVTPDLYKITAVSSVLHSFYNGVEKLFIFIAKNIDKNEPEGSRWHSDLLIQMCKSNDSRENVITSTIKNELMDYMAFRHFFRHTYSFFLRWSEMEPLVDNLLIVWKDLKGQIEEFISNSE